MHYRAIVREFGPAQDVVRLETYPPLQLSRDQVRIRLVARPINPSDVITISGAYLNRTPLPFVPGFEGVGVVEECGVDVEGLTVGMRVVPIGSAGSWQTFKDSEPRWCLAVPDEVSDVAAATSYVNPMTAWLMLHERLSIRPGTRLAINAAGSSIGLMLIKMANAHGISPVAIIRSSKSADRLTGLSLERIIDAGAPDYKEQMLRLQKSGGLDAILDCVGGGEALTTAHALRPGGRFVHYGLLSGESIPISFWSYRPDIDFSYFHLREWVHKSSHAKVQKTFGHVLGLVKTGLAASEIRETYSLEEVSKALDSALPFRGGGKVLLVS